MAELPSSWGLRTEKKDGKCVVIGKDDSGNDYRVRTCDSGGLTDRDVAEIAAVDRERYSSTEAAAKHFISGLVADGQARQDARERAFQDDLEEAAGPVVHAGLERAGGRVGYSRRYAQNFDSVFGGS